MINIIKIIPNTFLNIIHKLFSGFIEDPCKDITFGACTLDRSSIIKNGTQADAVTCQETCRNHDGCQFFRFSDQFNSKCTLLSKEYRRSCDIIGGSLVCNLSKKILNRQFFTLHLPCNFSSLEALKNALIVHPGHVRQ